MPAKRKQSTEQVGGAKRQKADRDSGYRSTENGTKYKETTSVDKHGEHEADFLMHDVSSQAKPDGYDGDNDSGRKGQSTRPTQPIFLQTVATSGPGSNVATYDTKHFRHAVPEKYVDWPLSCPQATERYDAPAHCPIKWDAFPEIATSQRRAYELRAPWDPMFKTWSQIANIVRQETGTKISDEGMRKRFVVANKIIFDATQVYFVNSGMGLQEYGYSNDTEVMKLLKEAERSKVTPKATINSQQAHHTPEAQRPGPQNKKGGVNIFELAEHNKLLVNDTVLEVVVNSKPWNPTHNTVRYIPRQTGIDHRLPRNITEEIMPWSATAFDLWYTMLYFKHRSSLPKHLWKIRRSFPNTRPARSSRSNRHNENRNSVARQTRRVERLIDPGHLGGPCYTHEDVGTFYPSMRILLEAYCLSHFARTQAISDMILDAIHEILIKDKSLIQMYSRGRVLKATDDTVVRFFDLTPKDIDNLWAQTDVDDPMRRLISDILHQAEGIGERPCINEGQVAVARYSKLYGSVGRDQIINDFAKGTNRKAFCILYHHHHRPHHRGWYTKCHRSEENSDMSEEYIDSSKISKDTQDLLDEYSKLRKFKHKGVVYTALDETKGRGLDWGYLQRKAPGWCWDKLRSLMTKVTIQADGMLRKGPVPIYYSAHEADDHGRFPSHPGYKDPNWILPKSDT